MDDSDDFSWPLVVDEFVADSYSRSAPLHKVLR